jgi:hypothetical protein
MNKDVVQLNALELIGPRSFFTDLDPRDSTYNQNEVSLKLKLQLLTKQKIVIAASSLFTDIGCELFSSEQGFIDTLEQGIVVPALRNEFESPADFFQRYKYKNCSGGSKNFFIEHVTHSVPWDLKENSSLFKETFYDHLMDPHSLLRNKTMMTESMAKDFLGLLNIEIQRNQSDYKYLRREYIYSVAKQFGDEINSYVSNYANLVYRISGSKVVNCDSHFPQSNLTNLGVSNDDKIVSDERIFWDIYVETIVSYLNSAVQLTPERLNKLSVFDILKIRKSLVDIQFSSEYDNLIKSAKNEIDIHDPYKAILKQVELNAAARSLRTKFAERLFDELQMKNTAVRENALWQIGNVLTLVPMPTVEIIIGSLSMLKSIPEITVLISESLSKAINRRYEWIRNFVNCKIGWNREQKRTLLEGYKELLNYGLPK